MRKQMTVPQQEKFAAYYEKWGCLRCDTKKTTIQASGYVPPVTP